MKPNWVAMFVGLGLAFGNMESEAAGSGICNLYTGANEDGMVEISVNFGERSHIEAVGKLIYENNQIAYLQVAKDAVQVKRGNANRISGGYSKSTGNISFTQFRSGHFLSSMSFTPIDHITGDVYSFALVSETRRTIIDWSSGVLVLPSGPPVNSCFG